MRIHADADPQHWFKPHFVVCINVLTVGYRFLFGLTNRAGLDGHNGLWFNFLEFYGLLCRTVSVELRVHRSGAVHHHQVHFYHIHSVLCHNTGPRKKGITFPPFYIDFVIEKRNNMKLCILTTVFTIILS
jgi:hypothetical protein